VIAAAVLIFAAAALGAAAAQAAAPTLAVPVECAIGAACVVQNHVDHEPGPSARDYRCGFLTYDGHRGTDIRVISSEALRRGVPVLAAAAGRVRAVRDGVPDASVRARGAGAVAGREAGNSVVIEHDDGWETQYAHLRQGSVAVRTGDAVVAGQRLGLVGLSGFTEFPHVHFEVRHRGRAVDPFVGPEGAEACRPGARPLWDGAALEALAYSATGLLGAAISAAAPRLDERPIDGAEVAPLTPAAGAALFWVAIYGAQVDDLQELRLIGPDGRVLAERRDRLSRHRAQWLAYVGRRRVDRDWPAGVYRGEYTLYRGPSREKVISLTREILLPP
jgi:murein DD-endopeptidase MepM/ murein hydrolase activator NlpD